MKHFLIQSTLLLLSSFSLAATATPANTTPGLETFNMKTCVEQNIQDCIKAACIESAPANCQEQCRTDALNKCKQISEQRL
ncbi:MULTISPECIES: hypothetical protein [unclassified Legionella]|uniref:hypothetical protein n=1 Tax=unclassified Legionella TaxID=2622702 RepID=UPI001055FA9C|nr:MULTISPECIES: hypothetical protein [unclassified Legionella]MDI9818062.1 hypothetical protein [Legionella sp. PL877]